MVGFHADRFELHRVILHDFLSEAHVRAPLGLLIYTRVFVFYMLHLSSEVFKR